MKKLYVHLSMLVLLAALLVPMIGCKKDDTEMEESPAATTVETATTVEPSAMATDMGTTDTMGTDMGTDMAPMGTEMSPPAGQ